MHTVSIYGEIPGHEGEALLEQHDFVSNADALDLARQLAADGAQRVTLNGNDIGAHGWVSARNGKWHRATVAEPTFMHDEATACGLTFRPLNVTWHGERPAARAPYMCQRSGCALT